MPEHYPNDPHSELLHYLPEELDLDVENAQDQQLYIESYGIREIGKLLIERQRLDSGFAAGELSREAYDRMARTFDGELADLYIKYGIMGNPGP